MAQVKNKFVDTIGSRIYVDMGEINLLYIYGMSVWQMLLFVGLMVKCTPERGQKCSLFHLIVKCTPIIVELPSVYRGCKPLICFQ